MTLGIGILTYQGIVFCADQQITQPGGHKFHERKLSYFRGPGWSTIFSYAGSRDLQKAVLHAFEDRMAVQSAPVTVETVRKTIEEVLCTRYSTDEIANLQLLCGLAIPGEDRRMLKNSGHRVGDAGYGLHIVGCGESSVVRYLAAMIANLPIASMEQAEWIAVNLVRVAKAWLDGVGGRIDLVALMPDGGVVERSPAVERIEGAGNAIEQLYANVLTDIAAMSDRASPTLYLTQVGHLRHDVLTPAAGSSRPGPLPPEWVAHFTGIRTDTQEPGGARDQDG